MLRIENRDKLVGESLVVTDSDGNLIVWKVDGVYEYGPDGVYQIRLRTTSLQNDKVFILSKEEGFMEANYKIRDAFDPSKSVWVRRAHVANVTSMVKTLRRIISHANN